LVFGKSAKYHTAVISKSTKGGTMFVLGNFLTAIATILHYIFQLCLWIIIIAALLSWVQPDPRNPIVQFLNRASDIFLHPIRKILPFSLKFGFDISPMIACLAIWFLDMFLIRTLQDIAFRLG
jgi:YggT family protein